MINLRIIIISAFCILAIARFDLIVGQTTACLESDTHKPHPEQEDDLVGEVILFINFFQKWFLN